MFHIREDEFKLNYTFRSNECESERNFLSSFIHLPEATPFIRDWCVFRFQESMFRYLQACFNQKQLIYAVCDVSQKTTITTYRTL